MTRHRKTAKDVDQSPFQPKETAASAQPRYRFLIFYTKMRLTRCPSEESWQASDDG